MAVTFALVESTAYRLRYLATCDGTGATANIPNDGGATPDLLTDLATDPSGPLRKIVRARLDGIGTVAAGALTQAQARAIFNSDNTANVGNDYVPRAILTFTIRTGAAIWSVDANVDGQGDPVIAVTCNSVASTAYIDIHARHSIDL